MNRVDIIARAAHEMNKAYCVFLGDREHVSWEETDEDIKESARDGVRFTLDNPDTTAAQSHENWVKHKEENGWVLGKTKSTEKKTHPCIKDYSKLPKDQRAKDVLFKQTVLNMAEMLMEIPVEMPVETAKPKIMPIPVDPSSIKPREKPEVGGIKSSGGGLRKRPVSKAIQRGVDFEAASGPDNPVPRVPPSPKGTKGGLIKAPDTTAAALAMFD